jgi:hypothetical protein
MTPVGVGEGQYDARFAAHRPSDGIRSKPLDMDMQGESTAAALSGSTPAKILHRAMSNPIKFKQKMRDRFGNKEGTAIFSQLGS